MLEPEHLAAQPGCSLAAGVAVQDAQVMAVRCIRPNMLHPSSSILQFLHHHLAWVDGILGPPALPL